MNSRLFRIYLFWLFTTSFVVVLGQTNSENTGLRDSLQIALKSAQHDSTRCSILNALIEAEPDDNIWPVYNQQLQSLAERNLKQYTHAGPMRAFFLKQYAAAVNNTGYLANLHGNTAKALESFEKGLALDKEANDKKGVIASLNNIGVLYQVQGSIKKALDCFQQSLTLSKEIKDKEGMAESYNNLGRIYIEKGDIPAALNYYDKSLRHYKEMQNIKGISIALNNLGYVYQQQGDTARALNYYTRSLALQEKLGEMDVLAGSLHNIGHVYFKQGKLTLALAYLNRSFEMSKKIGNKSGMAHCLNSIGLIYYKTGQIDKALVNWRQNLVLCEEINDKQSLALALNQIGTALFFQGQTKLAQSYCERSMKLSQELGFPDDIKTASGTLSQIYAKLGNWKKAWEMLTLHKRMNDSLSNETNHKAVLQKTFQFRYEKKAVADSIKAVSQSKLFEAQIKQDKTQRRALYFGISLLAFFALFIYNRFRVTQKQKKVIELKEKETQVQKNIIEEKHKEISDSIHYAERIQRSFLATDELLSKQLKEYFIFFKPKAVVSGDFYWAAELNNGCFAFVVADSTGHGVPGAIMSILNITSLEKAIESSSDPAEILNNTRQIIIERLKKDGSDEGGKDGMDCSIVTFNFKEQHLKYAAANNPIWVVRKNELLEFLPDKMPVGKHDHENISFKQHTIDFQKDDLLYLFTDGLPDQFGGPKGKKFMYKQLKEVLLNAAHLQMHEQKKVLQDAFKHWKGEAEQVDDITIVGIRIT
ncbi:MAG: tetratricopeptide repeat protein [bacterium]|nr:tetratricopeptide repeat protein [bacterium]